MYEYEAETGVSCHTFFTQLVNIYSKYYGWDVF